MTPRSAPGPAFPSTRWSRILAPGGQRDLEDLARTYWPPMRAWLAAHLRLAAADADDAAQEAFTWLLQRRLFDRADPARGSFRALLKTALRHFAIERFRKATADKRGGGAAPETIDPGREPVDATGRTPDQVLDAEWRRQLLEGAQAELQRELEQNGRGGHWLLFRDWFLDADDDVDHDALAARHGCSRTDVTNRLQYAKRRFRTLLQAAVRDTVADAEELQRELRWLFGADDRERSQP